MEKFIYILCALLGITMAVMSFPDGAVSVLVGIIIVIPIILLIRYYAEEKELLTNIFLAAVLVRLGFGLAIHLLDLRETFGPDANGYDAVGWRLVEIWYGQSVPDDVFTYKALTTETGWGMKYIVASIYVICGRNILAAQTFCGVIGAATAPIIYFCANNIFNNKRVARLSALFIVFFPSMIIWSGQLLKDGLIIFLLVLAMTLVLQLQKQLSYSAIALLVLSLFGIISLRFYIFYMMAVAIAGSLVIGLSTSVQSIARNIGAVLIIGLTLTYLGVVQVATDDFEKYGSLEQLQFRRQALIIGAGSGFGEDIDVSTPANVIAAIPIGFVYLMLSPFPWQITKINQAMLLPEMLVWWALIPILLSGLWYTLKNRLRSAIPILIFSLMLTISYSVFQGNVGMAYRQRTQIQVFLFVFIAVGWTLYQEHKENKRAMQIIKQQQIHKRLQANS